MQSSLGTAIQYLLFIHCMYYICHQDSSSKMGRGNVIFLIARLPRVYYNSERQNIYSEQCTPTSSMPTSQTLHVPPKLRRTSARYFLAM